MIALYGTRRHELKEPTCSSSETANRLQPPGIVCSHQFLETSAAGSLYNVTRGSPWQLMIKGRNSPILIIHGIHICSGRVCQACCTQNLCIGPRPTSKPNSFKSAVKVLGVLLLLCSCRRGSLLGLWILRVYIRMLLSTARDPTRAKHSGL